MYKKMLLTFMLIGFSVFTANADYSNVECSSDSVYSEYSCDQCFAGDELNTDNVYGFFKDTWINDSDTDFVLYKIEQTMPVFESLSKNTVFEQQPDNSNFWEYPEDMESLYDENEDGYILPAGESVDWISSTNGAGVKYSSLPNTGEKASILYFDTTVHPIIDGYPDLNSSQTHRECVVYTSGEELVGTPVREVITKEVVESGEEPQKFEENETVTEVQSGPAGILFFILIASMFSLAFLNRELVFAKIKK